MFTWIPIHREATHQILKHRQNQGELLAILREMEQQGLKVISLEDKDTDGRTIPLAEIDPFSFLATFNRGVTDRNRRENWVFLKSRWNLKAAVPDDFTGIPILHNMTSRLFPYAKDRERDHVSLLWELAALAAVGGVEKVDAALFNRCGKLATVGIRRLTICLFWIQPEKFLSADSKNTAYGKSKGIKTEPEDYQSYRQWLSEMTEKVGSNYPQVSDEAQLFATQQSESGIQRRERIAERWAKRHNQESKEVPDDISQPADSAQSADGALNEPIGEVASRQYWTLSVGTGGEHWEEFHEMGIAAIGWDGTPNLRDFRSKEELRQKLLELWPGDSSKKNDALACWQFAHDIAVGDIIFAKQGFTKLLGCGLVEGDYEFEAKRGRYRHVRRVKWLAKGEWELPEESKMASKTLTDITPYPQFVRVLAEKVGLDAAAAPTPADAVPLASTGVAYRWLNANPESFDKRKAMKGLFLAEAQFDEMLAALREKKNVVLQGAPGVGKTYVARRLAYALIASNDPQRIEMIQFHQSYSYEDFIQGFRPTPKGHFDLKYGIFYQFCRRAQRDEERPYVFIIDEINRGNLSKIFGELMMLIEADKRGKEHAIPLAYSTDADEKFYIPENLHLIGMMNTADRSLAMVDYALRRRFRFITLRPEFSSEAFRGVLADAGAKPELVQKIVARMTALNEIIAADTKNLGPGYQIGHSYFCPRNGIQPDNEWYCRVIESEIMPLIQEYWFDNEQKVRDQRMTLLA